MLFNDERNDITNLAPCGHEEADTRLLLHVADAANQGFTKVVVRTVDTDVVVISVAAFHQIQLSELWVAFGTGKHFRYLPVHDISSVSVQLSLKHFSPFTLSLGVTKHPSSHTAERRQPGKLGMLSVK